MIELSVEPYCENCMMFEADVNCSKFYANNQTVEVKTIVQCKRRKLCNNLTNYLKKEVDKR